MTNNRAIIIVKTVSNQAQARVKATTFEATEGHIIRRSKAGVSIQLYSPRVIAELSKNIKSITTNTKCTVYHYETSKYR